MNILILSWFTSFPINNWWAKKTYELANRLWKNNKVINYVPYVKRKNFFWFENKNIKIGNYNEFRQYSFFWYILNYFFEKLFFSWRFYFFKYKYSKDLIRLIDWSDVIIFNWPHLFRSTLDYNRPFFHLSFNVEYHRIWWFLKKFIKNRELDLIKRSKTTRACSQIDKDLYLSDLSPKVSNIEVLPTWLPQPIKSKYIPTVYKNDTRKKVVFVWSTYWPNIEWLEIIKKIAKESTNLLFVIIWSVCWTNKNSDNITYLWFVDDDDYWDYLCHADYAINPIISWWWASLKVADYLWAWLKIISTKFWSRWFENIISDPFLDDDWTNFESVMKALLNSKVFNSQSLWWNSIIEKLEYQLDIS